MVCRVCHERRKSYAHGECRRCYTKRINGRAMEKIATEFKPATGYNDKIFKIFLGDFDGRYIKNCDLPVAKKLAGYLATHQLEDILTWTNVYSCSAAAQIRYGNHPTQGCPFMRVGRQLERSGVLGRHREARVGQLKRLLADFPEALRPAMVQFYQDVASGHLRTSSALKVLTSVYKFHTTLGKLLWDANFSDAERFIDANCVYSAAHYTERFRSLNRFYTWAVLKEFCQTNPFAGVEHKHIKRQCSGCGQVHVFWTSDELCDECYKNKMFKKKFASLTGSVALPWSYNQQLLGLYLKYIDRYRIRSHQVRATKLLITFLGAKEIKAMKSWLDVSRVREAFMKFHALGKVPEKGCPIEKIAYVLQELGVLPIREEDHGVYVEHAICQADPAFAGLIREYLRELKRQRRSWRSLHVTFKMVHNFFLWSLARGNPDIFAASEELAREYILSRRTKDQCGVLRRVLDKFYRWAIFKKKTILNPFAAIESIMRRPSLEVCSNDTIRKLERFIKNTKSEPEAALILGLIFFYGFTAMDLAMASLDVNDSFTITLHRQSELTYAHNTHKRDQVLVLPKEPSWFLDLQQRYVVLWRQRLLKIKRDFPLSPLLLRSDSGHPRPLRTLAVQDRVKVAATAAVGFEIPVSVIRRTGAHVYTNQVDAAMLTEFGWSRDYAFDFVWRQRRLYSPKQK